MDAQAIMSAIGSLGFPIVMCLLMYKQNNETQSKHKEEMDSVREALNNNTLVLKELTDKLGKV